MTAKSRPISAGQAGQSERSLSDRGSQTLDRGLKLLDLLAAPESAQGVTVTALAASLGVGRPVVYRLVSTLEAHGYLTRFADGRVRLGFALARLSGVVLPMIREAATPFLRTLAEDVGATAHLTIVEDGEAVAVVVVEPTWTDMHVAYRTGSRHPLARGAAGRAIIAGRSGQHEWVTSDGELQSGAQGIAAPITATGIEGSVGVVSLGGLDELVVGPKVAGAARGVSAELR